MAKSAAFEKLHPRGQHGRFTKSWSKVMTAADRRKADKTRGGFKPSPFDADTLKAWKGQHSTDEQAAVGRFAGGGWRDINTSLRAGRTASPDVALLDSSARPLPHDVDLHRTVPLSVLQGWAPEDLVGRKVKDAGYAAASVDAPQVAGRPEVRMHISAPAGVKGFPTGEPGEVILARDAEMAIESVEPDGQGGFDMHLIVLPKKASAEVSKVARTAPPAVDPKAADFARWREHAARPGLRIEGGITPRQRRIAELQAEHAAAVAAHEQLVAATEADLKRRRVPLRERPDAIRAATRQSAFDIEQAAQAVESIRNFKAVGDWYDLPEGPRVGAQPTDPSNPLAVYGDLLHMDDESDSTHANLTDLEKAPTVMHATVRDHLVQSAGGGIYVGDLTVPDLDDLASLRESQPRGWGQGDTWAEVPGAYSPTKRVVALGHAHKGHGSHSLGLHEFGHGLDDAAGKALGYDGRASENPDWVVVHNGMRGQPYPYFTQPGKAGRSEAWAEAFAAWSDARAAGKDPADAIAAALGGASTLGYGRIDDETARKMADYFARLVDRLEGLGAQ